MRVLYLSGARAEEREVLAASAKIVLHEVQVRLRRDFPLVLLARLAGLLRAGRRFRPDLVLTETAAAYSWPALAVTERERIPLVVRLKGDPWREHDEIRHHAGPGQRLLRAANYRAALALLERADAIVPVSESLGRKVRRRLPAAAPCSIIANVHRPASPRSGPTAVSRRFLLSVTNFHFRDKVAPLVAAFPLVHPLLVHHDLDWLVIGEGAHRERCRREGLSFAERIHLPGFQDAAAHFQARPLVFLHLSDLDAGVPNAVLEAWAAGVPVAVNAGSSVAETLADDSCAQVVDLGTPAAARSELAPLLTDADLRRRLAEGGARRLLERHSRPAATAAWEDLLERCLAGRRERPR